MTCTFFGHKDTPIQIEPKLRRTLIELIENNDVRNFYIGNHGNFDRMVTKVLKELKITYPHISYTVVLAYLPTTKYDCDTVYPEGIENVPPRFAISYRNRYMIDKCNYVVTYVTRSFGGAVQFKELALKKGKLVIELS